MPTNPDDRQQVEIIAASGVDADPGRRSSALADSVSDGEPLRRLPGSRPVQRQTAGKPIEAVAFATLAEVPVPARPALRSPSSAGLPPQSLFSHYRILGKIGNGGMGVVYKAEDLKLRRRVALKFLSEEVAEHPQALQRFRLEARAASALNHPNICTIYEVNEVDGRVFMAMELLEGEPLTEFAGDAPLPVETVFDMGIQIAGAIHAAHAEGIVHRDIKPANIFVMKQRRVKVLDFGLAKLTQREPNTDETSLHHDKTELGTVMGTVGYMSPEQVRGQAVDHRTDIFAFGAILYEMLTGRRAFDKPTSAETMAAILNEEPPSVSQLAPNTPTALARVVRRCLEKEPDRRFQSASDLAFALEAFSFSGAEVSAPAATVPRSWREPVIIAGATAAVALATLFWWRATPAIPAIESVTQLSNDGEPKARGRNLFGDGSRLYFNEGLHGSQVIAQVSVNGGLTSRIETKLTNPSLLGVASDGSAMLALDLARNSSANPLWSIPLPAGEPRRLGNTDVTGAGFFPDGRIVYTSGKAVFVAESDGSGEHTILSLPGRTFFPRVSPDGKKIVVQMTLNGVVSLLEFGADGDGARTLNTGPGACCGAVWTPDGKYLIYQTRNGGSSDIWALAADESFFGRLLHRPEQPVRLTAGPLLYTSPFPSRDGKRIFAVGANPRGELTRYDLKSHQFQPYFSGISAWEPTFSRDGQWMSYASYPDGTLWRSRSDGSERLQLTYPPMQVHLPRISPDGTQVSFSSWDARTSSQQLYVIDMNGELPPRPVPVGEPGSVDSASWSPDSKQVLVEFKGNTPGEKSSAKLRIVDVHSGETWAVPDSEGMLGGKWVSPDTFLAATWDSMEFRLFDRKTRQWTDLVQGPFTAWELSPDREYVYYTTGGAEPKAWRLRFADRKAEEITSMRDPTRAEKMGWLNGIDSAPDGSPIFTRDTGSQEIYALDVRWP